MTNLTMCDEGVRGFVCMETDERRIVCSRDGDDRCYTSLCGRRDGGKRKGHKRQREAHTEEKMGAKSVYVTINLIIAASVFPFCSLLCLISTGQQKRC